MSNHWSLSHHSNLTVFGQKKVKMIFISQQKHYLCYNVCLCECVFHVCVCVCVWICKFFLHWGHSAVSALHIELAFIFIFYIFKLILINIVII